MMFVLFTAPVLNARGADQIKTEIRVHRLCLEGTKALVLIFIEYRTIILAYCIYYNCKGGELLSQHGSMLFNTLFIIWSLLAFTCRFHFVS